MPAPEGRIGHAELEIGESMIMLADEFPDMGAGPEVRRRLTRVDHACTSKTWTPSSPRRWRTAPRSSTPSRTSSTATARARSRTPSVTSGTSPPTSRTCRPTRWRSAWRSRRAAEPAGSRRPSLRRLNRSRGPRPIPERTSLRSLVISAFASPPAAADGGRRCRAGRRDGLTSTRPPPPGARCVPSRRSPACDRSWVVARPHASRSPIGDRLPALNDAPVGSAGGL